MLNTAETVQSDTATDSVSERSTSIPIEPVPSDAAIDSVSDTECATPTLVNTVFSASAPATPVPIETVPSDTETVTSYAATVGLFFSVPSYSLNDSFI